jgi:hypothetical protein
VPGTFGLLLAYTEQRKKLSEKELIEADTSEAKVEMSLSQYLNEYFGSRKLI